MTFAYFFAIFGGILSLVCFYIALAGFAVSVPVNLFNSAASVPAGLVVLGSWLAGLALALAYQQLTLRKAMGNEKKVEWQVQDVKLVAEIKSDREKQLEAKIATLETALSRALKKSSG